jgi:hypothetical protein
MSLARAEMGYLDPSLVLGLAVVCDRMADHAPKGFGGDSRGSQHVPCAVDHPVVIGIPEGDS